MWYFAIISFVMIEWLSGQAIHSHCAIASPDFRLQIHCYWYRLVLCEVRSDAEEQFWQFRECILCRVQFELEREYTAQSKNFSTDFLEIEDAWGRRIPFFIQNKLQWHMCIHRLCAVLQFLKSWRKFLFLDLLYFINYGLLDLSNIPKVESFEIHFQLAEQNIVWRR